MANNLNAGTSWGLLGLTIRLAQGLGLHRKCPPDTAPEHVYPRAKVWWGILWQDSLLSITYDRASTTALNVTTMPMPQHFGSTCEYHQSMYRVSKVALEIVNDRTQPMSPRETINRITEHRDELAATMKDSAEYLRDSRKCNSQRETLEHWGLYLHSSYIMSELCRPAISANADPDLAKFKQTCVENLINTVEAFLGLNNIVSMALVLTAPLLTVRNRPPLLANPGLLCIALSALPSCLASLASTTDKNEPSAWFNGLPTSWLISRTTSTLRRSRRPSSEVSTPL